MFLRFLLLFLFSTIPLYAQQHTLRFLDIERHKPIAGADVYTDSVFVAATNYNGNVKLNITGNYSNIIIDHIAYQKRTIPRDSLLIRKVYGLKRRIDMLDEVIVDKERLKDSLAEGYQNFGHGTKAATLVTAPDNVYISKLKFRVINTLGVKGLNFLPFMANVYELDSITKLPGKPLLPQDLLVENKTGADWAVVNISNYKLKFPKQGACIVFIIPAWNDNSGIYATRTIWSKGGEIDAVPYLKSKRVGKVSGSFLYMQYPYDPDYQTRPGLKWKPVKHSRYMIEAEFTKMD